jgi:hypothetical protein
MSQSRFAPITSDLLARKGTAGPSGLALKPALAWLQDRLDIAPPATAPAAPIPHPPAPHAEKPHRIMVALSNVEYETLGIAAVKKNTTRHLIARDALDFYFNQLAHEFHDECRCVSKAASCGCCKP